MGESKIRDNHDLGTVGDFLKDNIKDDCKIDVVSAYFTISAYHYLKERLDAIDSMRFLFGEPTFIKQVDPTDKNLKSYKIEFDQASEQLRISMAERLTQKKIARECHDWLEKKAEIKSMVKPNFLHGKMYHIKQKSGIEKAIAGSSNFTASGLGLCGQRNIELNLIVDSDSDRADLGKWFESIWNGNQDITQDVKDDVLRYLLQMYAENAPEFIYYKTLFHVFGEFLESQSEKDFEASKHLYDSKIWNSLYEFQKVGVKGALNRIRKNGGCIIADSVGLGKTYEALAIIKEFELKNKNVLVICPKKLSENWKVFQASQNHVSNPFRDDKFQYNILYHTDMGRISGTTPDGASFETFNWSAYDLVVVDESHNFKGNVKCKTDGEGNEKLNRAAWLMEKIIKQGADTKVLLLSATPVNTSLKDLRNQISLIIHNDNRRIMFQDSTGIDDYGQLLKIAQTQFTKWAENLRKPSEQSDDKEATAQSPKHTLENLDSGFFKLLDELTIARSRKHIVSAYSEADIGKFPEKLPPEPIYPNMDLRNEFPAYDKINEQILDYKLSVFSPSQYIKPEMQQHYAAQAESVVKAFKQEDRENCLIGMMKMNFLKRLESSIYSFAITIDRTIQKIDNLRDKINDYKKSKIKDAAFEMGPDSFGDAADENIDDLFAELSEDEDYGSDYEAMWRVGKKLKFDLKDLELDQWLDDLEKDKQALKKLFDNARTVNAQRDAKLDELKKRILKKQNEPLNPVNKKVLVFTAFSDTAKYLYEELLPLAKDNRLHIALVTGSDTKTTYGKNTFEHILTNFSPVSKNRPDTGEEIDILIGTDCISEGQNLQDCDMVINYDIHWNPVRIIQRFGRIDRLKSKNEKIQLVNFWPTKALDKYIKLKSRVEERMALGNIAATGEDDLFDNQELNSVVRDGELKFREKQLLRLNEEVMDIEELDESITLTDFSLEDFRMELLVYIENNRAKLENAPLGIYAVVPNAADSKNGSFNESEKGIIRPGIIFCLKQKNGTTTGERVNPVAPYFLVYIRQDGSVRYNYVHIKQIFDIFRRLCQGVKNLYDELCDLFNAETNHGEKMDVCADLLKKAIKEIEKTYGKRNADLLTTGGRKFILGEQIQNEDEDDSFELITWLVIK